MPTKYIPTVPRDPLFSSTTAELPHSYLYCNFPINPSNPSFNPDLKTYALMASLESGAGNIQGTTWATDSRYINTGYNYVISNFTPP